MELKKLLLESMGKEDLYKHNLKFFNALNKLNEKKDKDFLKFLWEKRKEGISIARLYKYYSTYKKFLKDYNLKNIKKKDFDLIYLKIKNSNYENTTKSSHLIIAKIIVNFYNPELNLTNYKIKEERKPLMSEDLLTYNIKFF